MAAVALREPYLCTLTAMPRNPPEIRIESSIQQGNRAGRGCLWTLLGMFLAGGLFGALYFWGGLVGHAILAAVGTALAGFLFPWTVAEPKGSNQERFLLYFSIVLAAGGLLVGIWMILTAKEPPWWVYALAAAGLVVLGGWAFGRGHQR